MGGGRGGGEGKEGKEGGMLDPSISLTHSFNGHQECLGTQCGPLACSAIPVHMSAFHYEKQTSRRNS